MHSKIIWVTTLTFQGHVTSSMTTVDTKFSPTSHVLLPTLAMLDRAGYTLGFAAHF